MDKDTLVIEVKAVLDSFLAEGKDLSFAALVPVYPGLPSTSYTLLLNGFSRGLFLNQSRL